MKNTQIDLFTPMVICEKMDVIFQSSINAFHLKPVKKRRLLQGKCMKARTHSKVLSSDSG
jgi:hypothetical protein